ncbi:MAG TPA: hypothetical protein VLB87_12435 [Pyrinomonadaceae bacterium]|nr:hypothetical protein [Pyrinomonadaceae bacterium]
MTKSLSPWKGGGFGMFSTVDSPDARFLRIYLLNGNEETAVLLPDHLKTLGRELQTIPSEALASELARRLAHGTWTPYRMTDPVRHYQNTRNDDDSLSGLAGPSDAAPTSGNPSDVVKTLPDGQVIFPKLLRMREKGAPGSKGEEAVAFQRVRVEVWRYSLDVGASQLKAAKFLETTADAQP